MLKPYLSIIITFAFLLSCGDYNEDTNEGRSYTLWPESVKSVDVSEITLPSQEDDIIRITDVKQPSIDIFLADRGNSNPGMLVFPGGGYNILAYDLEGSEVAKWLNKIGITAFVVKYTVPNDRESAFHDAQRAIRIIRNNAEKWGLDTTKIGVLGFSAGAHLAARLSTDFKSSSYPKIDVADEFSSRPDFSILIYPAYLNGEGTAKVAPEVQPVEKTPPVFIVQTEDDSMFVSGTKLFSRALDSIGVDYTFHLIQKGGHGYGLRADTSLMISKWPTLAEDWLIDQNIFN